MKVEILSLLVTSFLRHLMQEVTQYSKIWRYDYNQSKSGVEVFGESRVQHNREKRARHWEIDGNVVTELDEYKNLGVVKNYTSSSRLNISEAIEKTRKKAGMLLSGCTDRRKTNPTFYIKLWHKVCLPTLLYGAELWTLNSSLLADLERCQVWILKKVLHFPKFAHNLFVLKVCNMHSIQSEIDCRKFLFFARLILKEHGNLVSELFKFRVKSYFVDTPCSTGFIKEVMQLLSKYDLSHHFIDWYHTVFLPCSEWKQTVKICIKSIKENVYWTEFAISHESVSKNVSAFEGVTFETFLSITSEYPDLVPKRNLQLRLIRNLGLLSGIPWLRIKSEDKCLLCRIEKEDMIHFALRCRYFFNDWKSFWYRLRQVILASSDGDAQTFLLFVKNLDNSSRIRLLTGCLKIPFNIDLRQKVEKFIAVSVRKNYRIRRTRITRLGVTPGSK